MDAQFEMWEVRVRVTVDVGPLVGRVEPCAFAPPMLDPGWGCEKRRGIRCGKLKSGTKRWPAENPKGTGVKHLQIFASIKSSIVYSQGLSRCSLTASSAAFFAGIFRFSLCDLTLELLRHSNHIVFHRFDT